MAAMGKWHATLNVWFLWLKIIWNKKYNQLIVMQMIIITCDILLNR